VSVLQWLSSDMRLICTACIQTLECNGASLNSSDQDPRLQLDLQPKTIAISHIFAVTVRCPGHSDTKRMCSMLLKAQLL
jgi:hypothetical protein